MKILEQNEDYEIIEDVFNGQPITIRCWHGCRDAVELRVNDNFARANGYKSVEDMVERTVGAETFYQMYGRVPQWITARVTPDGRGEFYFQEPQRIDVN